MRILFVCTGNTCRSPMAETLAKSLAQSTGRAVDFSSAGLSAADGDRASSGAVQAMKMRGLDLSRHASRRATKEILASADRIFVMTESHRRQLAASYPDFAAKTEKIAGHRDVGDPFGASLEIYEHVAGELEREIKRILADLPTSA